MAFGRISLLCFVRVTEPHRQIDRRGPPGVFLTRRERGRTALQAAERSAKRAKAEKALRDEEARLALIEAQKVQTLCC